ncbi:MAG: type II secretion system protein N [Pseudomonadota bacterium]
MSSSFRQMSVVLGVGLLAGVGIGYWLGLNAATSAANENAHIGDSVVAPEAPVVSASAAQVVTGPPSNLLLVGTAVGDQQSKSKAWLTQKDSELTQTFQEGDLLPGAYKVESIAPDSVTTSKNGQQFIIRRNSTNSSSTATTPVSSQPQAAPRFERALAERRGKLPERAARWDRQGQAATKPIGDGAVSGWAAAAESDEANAEQVSTPEEKE